MPTVPKTNDGLTVAVYRGDGAALLAFDASGDLAENLAGFAVEYTPPGGQAQPIQNRLSFENPMTAETTPEERVWTPTTEAPLQKFHWMHFPPDVKNGEFAYEVTAMLFAGDGAGGVQLKRGPSVDVSLELLDEGFANFDVGFTRGYLSSQAYATKFNNAAVAPDDPSIDFATAEFEERWAWLGFHARKLAFDFLEETIGDDGLSLDVFAYDLNEPDILRDFAKLGPRLRLFLDDSKEHVKAGARELAAKAMLEDSTGAENIKIGHFSRFAHDKILIQRRGDTAVKVLSGSANFSIRGLYVQANNVFVFNDQDLAGLYGRVFDSVWTDPHAFSHSDLAKQWFEHTGADLPDLAVSFSPHADPDVSLDRVAEAIRGAKSSVLFSVMDLGGGGEVMDEIHGLPGRQLYAFGTTQNPEGDLSVTSPNHPAVAVPFSYLHDKVPDPFKPEISGGGGQVIHNKFVVVDFNGETPLAFAGSSNLAEGGEHENGDNLVCFSDAQVATTYAVEAIRLIDHYRFRAVQKTATTTEPLALKKRTEDWVPDYYDAQNPKFRERTVFIPKAPSN
jgi:hypothetical protein